LEKVADEMYFLNQRIGILLAARQLLDKDLVPVKI
jgi:hypothetical protein